MFATIALAKTKQADVDYADKDGKIANGCLLAGQPLR